MTVHVFATYTPETYLVEANSEMEAKGKLSEANGPGGSVEFLGGVGGSVEYLGTVEEVMGDEGDVVRPRP